MPDYILMDDVIDEMLDNISLLKLKTYFNLDEDNSNLNYYEKN